MDFDKIKYRRTILGLMVSFFCLFSACGGSDTPSRDPDSAAGDLSFSVVYHGAGNSRVQAAVIDCAGEGIETVEAAVYSSEGAPLVRGGPWQCDAGRGTISSVPAGSGRIIVILGKNNEANVIFRGQQTGIQVNANQENNVGTIECFNFTPELNTPVDGSVVNADTMGLSWSNITGATKYHVIISVNSELIDPIIEMNTAIENYTPIGLSDATTYYWQVVAGDAYDNTGTSQIWLFTVDEHHQNTAPVAQITSPADGSIFTSDDSITFSGSGSDNEDGDLSDKSLVWRSDVDGMIGTGETFTSETLSESNHEITLTATDSEGETGMDSVSITVNSAPDNTPPVAQITCPVDGIIYNDGDTLAFSGIGSDSNDGDLSGDALVWRSDVDGRIGTGKSFTLDSLTPGHHQITLKATDSDWMEGTDAVSIDFNTDTPTGNVPDTGQNLSYTATFGEDSDYIINPPQYTKLDASGNALHACATQWSMVRDEVTGLIWEVKTDDDSIHDMNNEYMWSSVQDDFIDILNGLQFGGLTHWRLPTVRELYSIVRKGSHPSVYTAYFPYTGGLFYWSNTTNAGFTQNAWEVGFSIGSISHNNKSSYDVRLTVRAVHGPLLSNDLVNNGDGTVADTTAGLMWEQAEKSATTWESALAYCEALTLAGQDDWRLPNAKELQSLVNYGKTHPAIDTTCFPNAHSDFYWTATSHSSDYAFCVYFSNGKVNVYKKTENHFIRAVRNLQ